MPMHSLERRLADAQGMTTIMIAGERHARIVYGKERAPWVTAVPCHDCSARAGMVHIPGCDVEECPRCHGLLNFCACAIRDDDEHEGDDEPSADRSATTSHDGACGDRLDPPRACGDRLDPPRARDDRRPEPRAHDCHRTEPVARDDRRAEPHAYDDRRAEPHAHDDRRAEPRAHDDRRDPPRAHDRHCTEAGVDGGGGGDRRAGFGEAGARAGPR